MDLSQHSLSPTNLLTQFTQVGIPAFIMSTFGPSLQAKLALHPRLMRMLSIILTLYLTISLSSSFLIGWLPRFWANLMSYGMSHIDVSASDATLNRDLTTWLATRRLIMVERFQSARSAFYLRQQQRNMGYSHPSRAQRRNPAMSSHEDRDDTPDGIVFHPKNDLQILFHRKRIFLLTMSNSLREGYGGNAVPITIWCFGWSPVPIQNLLVEIQDAQRASENVLTQILTPQSGCGSNWVEQTLKRARPLDSVYLDTAEKEKLISDMTEYLNGETRSWYQDRGIPYRRGYLFHGSPGTGKSSLALALAGHFKLSVYIVSLTANGMTDYNLQYLFQALQPGCLVLLEDVDSAGLVRENGAGLTAAERKRQLRQGRYDRGGKRRSRRDRDRHAEVYQQRDVTLSGLLNAIDGPGSPEGHVLIMTTNCPEELDDALVRAGRVDVRIEFQLAQKAQIREIFYSLYKSFPTSKPKTKNPAKNGDKTEDEKEALCEEQGPTPEQIEKETAEYNTLISTLADTFSTTVPENEFSPAQLQDYILLHKNQPQRAIDSTEKWIRDHFAEKARLEADETESDSSSSSSGSEDEDDEGGRRRRRRDQSEEDSYGPKTPSSSEPLVIVHPDGSRKGIDWSQLAKMKETDSLIGRDFLGIRPPPPASGMPDAVSAGAVETPQQKSDKHAGAEKIDIAGVQIDKEWLDAIKKIAVQIGQAEKNNASNKEQDQHQDEYQNQHRGSPQRVTEMIEGGNNEPSKEDVDGAGPGKLQIVDDGVDVGA